MIRLATKNDIPEIVEVCRAFYDEIAFGPLVGLYEPEHIHETFRPCNGPDSVLVISVEDGKINGVFYAVIMRINYYQRQVSIAEEIVWHVSPMLSGFKRIKTMDTMLKFAEPHISAKGAKIHSIGTRLSNDAAGRLLTKNSYTETGRRFYKEFSHDN